MKKSLSDVDLLHLRRAIELAVKAEAEGNLPIGCVISFNKEIVAEGKNTMWVPEFNPIRHAEIEALQGVSRELWENSRKISVYSTLEPCLMCTAAILQHSVGKVIFGSLDKYGGTGCVFGNMPPYFEEELASVQWIGPVLPKECDPLYNRAIELIEKRRETIK